MLKYLCYILLLTSLGFAESLRAEVATEDQATYESLLSNPYTDHVQHFKKLFAHAQISSLLEFGLGYGTKYFLNHCQAVTSIEWILPGQDRNWYDHTTALLQNYSHWDPRLQFGTERMQEANVRCHAHLQDPALYDASYLLDIKDLCDQICAEKQYEVAFVDPGFHMRGDLVNALFDRVPIIVAHDTNVGYRQYGWYKIHTPSNYEKIVCPEGMGVTFWIRHDYRDLIVALGGRPPKGPKKLRVFFPQIHPILVKSFALALHHLGHTLVLPGESFSPSSPLPGHKIGYGTFFKKNAIDTADSYTLFFTTESPGEACAFLKHVEVIENQEILSNPPDVLVANCLDVAPNIYSIYDAIPKSQRPKLLHFSGNNTTPFDANRVENLIAVDAYTANAYNPFEKQIIVWIPWIDFERFSFEGTSDDNNINSYINHYSKAFAHGFSIFNDIVHKTAKDFPSLEIHSYPKQLPNSFPYVRHDQVGALIHNSCATLHIKETDGFGYTIIESLAKGRPVFLKRSFSVGSRMMNWCIEGKTAFFFDDYEEFSGKLRAYIGDQANKHRIQNECAHIIRRFIDNEQQARILDKFLQNLK